MVPGTDRRIKKIRVPDLVADHKVYFRIVQDMIRHGGTLIPDPNWLMLVEYEKNTDDLRASLEFAQSEEAYQKQFSKMNNLMPAWIGATAAEFPSADAIAKYHRFLEHGDPLGLWHANIPKGGDGIPFLKADLGSIMDLNLLYAFSDCQSRSVTRVLEVGGGYGRLAEAAFNIFGHSLRYVLVDAVPGSLYYSRKYLSHACPDARIISFYDSGRADLDLNLDEFDIAIVPSWHFERLNRSNYDICVNIESMQEMNQAHVDYYLELFQSVSTDGATIYISNARDYYFRGSFNYPANWRRLFASNTPRSWKQDHPTEIFRKTAADCSLPSSMIESAYNYGLWLQKDPEEFVSRNGCRDVIAPLSKEIVHGLRWRWRRAIGPRIAAR